MTSRWSLPTSSRTRSTRFRRITFAWSIATPRRTSATSIFAPSRPLTSSSTAGHIGYGVHHACRGTLRDARNPPTIPLARELHLNPLWVTCDPDNMASRRSCELAGAEFVEIVRRPDDLHHPPKRPHPEMPLPFARRQRRLAIRDLWPAGSCSPEQNHQPVRSREPVTFLIFRSQSKKSGHNERGHREGVRESRMK